MNSVILRTAAYFLIPLQVAFSLFLLLRGHNEPGGGFAAGLVVGAALALHGIAYSTAATRRVLLVDPVVIAGLGLVLALLSGGFGLVAAGPYLEGKWIELDLGLLHWEIGTPLLFDAGVYLVVIGVAATVLLNLMERR